MGSNPTSSAKAESPWETGGFLASTTPLGSPVGSPAARITFMPRSSAYGLPCSIHHKTLSSGRKAFVARADIPASLTTSRRRIKAQGRDLPQAIARLIVNLRKANAQAVADELLDAACHQFGQGFTQRVDAATPANGPTVLETLHEHLRRRHGGGHLKLASYQRGLGLIDNHVDGEPIAKALLVAVTTEDLRAFFDHLATKTNPDGTVMLGPTPRRSLHGFFNQIFTTAEEQGIITRSPMRGVERPKKPSVKRDGAARKPGAVQRIMQLVQHQLPYEDFLFVFPLVLGMRTSERLGLLHSAIEYQLDGIDVHITRQLDRENYPELTSILKTDAGYRSLPLNALARPHFDALHLRRALERAHQGQIDESVPLNGVATAAGARQTMLFHNDVLLFENTKGQPVRQQSAGRQWSKLRAQFLADEPTFVEHDFRHIAATALVNDGFSDVVIDRYLGHSTQGRITHTYAHAGRDDLAKAANSLLATFSRWPQPPDIQVEDLPELIRAFPRDTHLSSLWRSISKPELALGEYVKHHRENPAELDKRLRHLHGLGLLDLAYSEAYLPPEFRHVTDEHLDWAFDDAREHGSWVTALTL